MNFVDFNPRAFYIPLIYARIYAFKQNVRPLVVYSLISWMDGNRFSHSLAGIVVHIAAK